MNYKISRKGENEKMNKNKDMLSTNYEKEVGKRSEKVREVISCIITIIWILSFLALIITSIMQVSFFGVLAAILFGCSTIAKMMMSDDGVSLLPTIILVVGLAVFVVFLPSLRRFITVLLSGLGL